MKIKKGTLVILFYRNRSGGKILNSLPLSGGLGLVTEINDYQFGKGFEVRDFSERFRTYTEGQMIGIAQVAPSLRECGIKKILEKYHFAILRRLTQGIRGLNDSLQGICGLMG